MCRLKITLLFVLIFHLHTSLQERGNNQNRDDLPPPPRYLRTSDSQSKSVEPKSHILPLIAIKHSERSFERPTTIEHSTWEKGNKFLTAETLFSDSLPGTQIFFCGQDSYDKYCSFPVHFEGSDILQCTQEPKPLLKKYLISSPNQSIDVPCGENKRGRLYRFIYQICMLEEIDKTKRQNSNSDQKPGGVKIVDNFESYRLCLDIEKEELIYTRHKLQSLDLFSDERLKQERQMTYDFTTKGYIHFKSWFEEIKRRNNALEEYGYTPIKMVPSNHFPLASWKKPVYHHLNTMPIQWELGLIWEYIFNSIRRDAIQKKRKYEFYTRAFLMPENWKPPLDKLNPPHVLITLITYEYIQKDNRNGLDFAVAIMLNNQFQRNFDVEVDEFITNNYCQKSLCGKEFPEPYTRFTKAVHCCAVNDAIKLLFEERINVDRVLKPDFIYESEANSPQGSPGKTSKRNIRGLTRLLTRIQS